MLNDKIQKKWIEFCRYNPERLIESQNKGDFWLDVMKENEIFYREIEIEEKKELRKEKLKKIDESR